MAFTTYDRQTAHMGPSRVSVAGSWRPDGSTGIVSGSVKGKGFTVARADVGLYTITFSEVGVALESVVFGVRAADATPTIVQGGDLDMTAKTLQVRVLQESAGTLAVADMAADADAEVSFHAVFKNTNV